MTTEPVKAVYKPGKFDHVDSKVAQEVKVWRDLIIIIYHHLRVTSHLDCGLIAGYIISLSSGCLFKHLALVVQRLKSTIHRINLYPVESAIIISFPY